MSLFKVFATFGVFAVNALVILSTAAVGWATPDPTGAVWVAMSAFVALLTFWLAVGFWKAKLIHA